MARPKKNKSLTEEQVREFFQINEEVKTLKSKLQAAEEDRDQKQALIYEALKNGAKTDHLTYDCVSKESERRYPPWKEHFIQFAGQKKADLILKKTQPIVYNTVIVTKKTKLIPVGEE